MNKKTLLILITLTSATLYLFKNQIIQVYNKYQLIGEWVMYDFKPPSYKNNSNSNREVEIARLSDALRARCNSKSLEIKYLRDGTFFTLDNYHGRTTSGTYSFKENQITRQVGAFGRQARPQVLKVIQISNEVLVVEIENGFQYIYVKKSKSD